MTTSATQHDQPPPGLNCECCRLIFLAVHAAPTVGQNAIKPMVSASVDTIRMG
jgi:hypothetical protein